MPDHWQGAFIQSGRELKDCTLNFLTEYMENQREFTIINEQRNKRHHELDQAVFYGCPKYSHRNTRRSFRRGCPHHRNNHTHNGTQKATSDDQHYCCNEAPCPIHLEGKHKWGMCF